MATVAGVAAEVLPVGTACTSIKATESPLRLFARVAQSRRKRSDIDALLRAIRSLRQTNPLPRIDMLTPF